MQWAPVGKTTLIGVGHRTSGLESGRLRPTDTLAQPTGQCTHPVGSAGSWARAPHPRRAGPQQKLNAGIIGLSPAPTFVTRVAATTSRAPHATGSGSGPESAHSSAPPAPPAPAYPPVNRLYSRFSALASRDLGASAHWPGVTCRLAPFSFGPSCEAKSINSRRSPHPLSRERQAQPNARAVSASESECPAPSVKPVSERRASVLTPYFGRSPPLDRSQSALGSPGPAPPIIARVRPERTIASSYETLAAPISLGSCPSPPTSVSPVMRTTPVALPRAAAMSLENNHACPMAIGAESPPGRLDQPLTQAPPTEDNFRLSPTRDFDFDLDLPELFPDIAHLPGDADVNRPLALPDPTHPPSILFEAFVPVVPSPQPEVTWPDIGEPVVTSPQPEVTWCIDIDELGPVACVNPREIEGQAVSAAPRPDPTCLPLEPATPDELDTPTLERAFQFEASGFDLLEFVTNQTVHADLPQFLELAADVGPSPTDEPVALATVDLDQLAPSPPAGKRRTTPCLGKPRGRPPSQARPVTRKRPAPDHAYGQTAQAPVAGEDIQEAKYRRMRDLNNEASKRCRQNRKHKSEKLGSEEEQLELRQRQLKLRCQQLEDVVRELKRRFIDQVARPAPIDLDRWVQQNLALA
eukprot:maker-scaffold494_size155699-snap-gene-0.20 protein:Tk10272 transcript:maker-scaffold494_size155699-snap-gene-0.20-mRNA-1 annotation:"hypothetical protein"